MQIDLRISPLVRSSRTRCWYPLAALALLCLLGCKPQAEIVTYTVKRETPPASISAATGEPRDRMLGAIVPQGEMNWFFKLTGAKQAVAELTESFETFLKSVKFTAGPGNTKPTWTLPAGWQQKPGSDIRFATIEIPAEPKPIELTVIPLPRDPQADDAPAILANVNRWRGQLDLSPLDAAELADQTTQLDAAGVKVTVVDFEGTLTGAGMAPFAGGGGGAPRGPFAAPPNAPTASPVKPSSGPAPGEALPFEHGTAEGWIAAPASGLRKLAYRIGDKPDAEMTVIDLAVAASDTLPNVNRWRTQVALEATTAEQLSTQTKKLKLGAAEGEYVELFGAEKGMLGVIVRHADRGWFFKLTGDRAAVEQEKARFETFMQSVKFK